MHKYLRAVGFSDCVDWKREKNLAREVIEGADIKRLVRVGKEFAFSECDRLYGGNLGIAVCGDGEMEDSGEYIYLYPFLRSYVPSSREEVCIERHAAKESYAGVCEDSRLGTSLIFYLQNMADYLPYRDAEECVITGGTLFLSALSCQGTVMLPIRKTERQRRKIRHDTVNRNRLIQAAREGDEEAIESLTMEDMDTYTAMSRKLQKEDLFSLVDTYFMPFGVECDLYSILGEIAGCRTVANSVTAEVVHILDVVANDIPVQVAINEKDLLGEPLPGRRFKGDIWLQGYLQLPQQEQEATE